MTQAETILAEMDHHAPPAWLVKAVKKARLLPLTSLLDAPWHYVSDVPADATTWRHAVVDFPSPHLARGRELTLRRFRLHAPNGEAFYIWIGPDAKTGIVYWSFRWCTDSAGGRSVSRRFTPHRQEPLD